MNLKTESAGSEPVAEPSGGQEPNNGIKQSVGFDVTYRTLNKTTEGKPRDPLAENRAATAHVEKLGAAIRLRNLSTEIIAGNPLFQPDGITIPFTVTSTVKVGRSLPASTTALKESILAVLQDIANAGCFVRAGDEAVRKYMALIENEESETPVTLPKIKPAKPAQTEIAKVGDDASIYVTNAHGVELAHRYRSILKVAADVNACAMAISVTLGKTKLEFPALTESMVKPDWLADGCKTEVGKITGFFRQHRMVEVEIDGTSEMLVVPADEVAKYVTAIKEGKWARIELQVSRPGNPFHGDDEKIKISKTLELIDPIDPSLFKSEE